MIKPNIILKINELYNIISKNKSFYRIVNHYGQFADEPHHFLYSFISKRLNIVGCSLTLSTPQKAILGSLNETAERFSLFSKGKHIESVKIENIKNQIIPLDSYGEINNSDLTQLDFVPIKQIGTNKTFYIPKLLVFLGDKSKSQMIKTSCGTSGGFDKNRTKLKSISELIEYDTALLWYFGLLEAKRIDLAMIKNPQIKKIVQNFKWYKLELECIEIINDIGIPVYISFIIDKTKVGPAISLGLGVGLQNLDGLMHSIEEALQTRLFTRGLMLESAMFPSQLNRLAEFNKVNRLLFWAREDNAQFLIKKIYSLSLIKNPQNSKKSYENIINVYRKKNVFFYLIDISYPELHSINYYVYKFFSPELQPLYLDEHLKRININRMKSISSNYNSNIINTLPPHPFP